MSNNRDSGLYRKIMEKKLAERANRGEDAPKEQEANALDNDKQATDAGYQAADDIVDNTPTDSEDQEIEPMVDDRPTDGGYHVADQIVDNPPIESEDQEADEMLDNRPTDGGYQAAVQTTDGTTPAGEPHEVEDIVDNAPTDGGYQTPGDSASDNAINQIDQPMTASPNINRPMSAPPIPDKNENLSAPSSPSIDHSLSVTPMLKRKGQKDAYIAPNKSYDTEILAQNGFAQRIDIKSGVTGTIGHYTYTGDNPDLKAFAAASDNHVLVKIKATDEDRATRASSDSDAARITQEKIHASQTYDNEKSLAGDIAKNQSATRAGLMTVTLSGKVDGIERKTTVIVTEPIYYNKSQLDKDMKEIEAKIPKQEKSIKELEEKLAKEKDPEELTRRQEKLNYAKGAIPRLVSAAVKGSLKNSQDYMEELGKNKNSSPEIQFKTVFSTAFEAQTQLHKDGLLHLDSQPRNFVVQMNNNLPNARIIDFGASRKCDENGVALSNKPFPLDPIYFYNQDALNLGIGGRPPQYSVQTDIFSFRMNMIESMAFYAGAGKGEIDRMHMNGLQPPEQTNPVINGGKPRDVDILAANDDMTRINNSLGNLEKYLQANEVSNALTGGNTSNIHHTRETIATYKAYLTSPIPQGSLQEVIQHNENAFANTQPSAIPKPSEQHTRLLDAFSHINKMNDSSRKCDNLMELAAKNPEALAAYGDPAKRSILYQAREFALSTAREQKEGHEQYAEMAKKLDDITRSPGTLDQNFKKFCDYASECHASKVNLRAEKDKSPSRFTY